MTRPDATLTTQHPGQPPHTRPVPPSWATVAPLLERWQLALVPHRDHSWDVLAFHPAVVAAPACARQVPFAGLPQAIADVAQRCEKECRRENAEWKMENGE